MAITALLIIALWQPFQLSGENAHRPRVDLPSPTRVERTWVYGRPDARFTIIAYADFTCPYCRQYVPQLQRWIDEHTDINLKWHHLPLASHGAEALRLARLAECIGMTQGNAAFWRAVGWIWRQASPERFRASADAAPAERSESVRACMRSPEVDVQIQKHVDAAARGHIEATPTLQLTDQKTGRMLTIQGMVEMDALLSAIDRLIGPGAEP